MLVICAITAALTGCTGMSFPGKKTERPQPETVMYKHNGITVRYLWPYGKDTYLLVENDNPEAYQLDIMQGRDIWISGWIPGKDIMVTREKGDVRSLGGKKFSDHSEPYDRPGTRINRPFNELFDFSDMKIKKDEVGGSIYDIDMTMKNVSDSAVTIDATIYGVLRDDKNRVVGVSDFEINGATLHPAIAAGGQCTMRAEVFQGEKDEPDIHTVKSIDIYADGECTAPLG